MSDNDPDGGQNLNTNSPVEPYSLVPSGHELNREELQEAGRLELEKGLMEGRSSPNPPQLRTRFKNDSSPGRAKGGPNVLPFEFRALEACLEATCSCLDEEVFLCN